MEHVRDGRSVPRLPPPVDFNAMPLMRPLVAAFRWTLERLHVLRKSQSVPAFRQRVTNLFPRRPDAVPFSRQVNSQITNENRPCGKRQTAASPSQVAFRRIIGL